MEAPANHPGFINRTNLIHYVGIIREDRYLQAQDLIRIWLPKQINAPCLYAGWSVKMGRQAGLRISARITEPLIVSPQPDPIRNGFPGGGSGR
jgi:hypothetical protein